MIKLIDLLKEELVGEFDGIEVYKNPKSIKRMESDIRAISDPKGNLYVMNDAWRKIHSNLEWWLRKKGYVNINTDVQDWKSAYKMMIKNGYVHWTRKGNTDSFYLSESTTTNSDWFNKKELMPYLKKSMNKVKSKNPKFKFVLETI